MDNIKTYKFKNSARILITFFILILSHQAISNFLLVGFNYMSLFLLVIIISLLNFIINSFGKYIELEGSRLRYFEKNCLDYECDLTKVYFETIISRGKSNSYKLFIIENDNKTTINCTNFNHSELFSEIKKYDVNKNMQDMLYEDLKTEIKEKFKLK